MATISGSINQTVTLASVGSYPGTYASPLTITATGTVAVSGTGADGVFGPAGDAWTVNNQGGITATGRGVILAAGGSVINSGRIEAGGSGVVIQGDSSTATGYVANSGTIIGDDVRAIALYYGGTVTNSAAGLIEGFNGVVILGRAGTVTNSGTISGSSSPGVFLSRGGTVTNSGTITGAGGISGVYLDAGGSVTNTNAGLIQGYSGVISNGSAGTITNSGTISGTGGVGVGVNLGAGGSVADNAGLIQGYTGVIISGGAGTVTNSGTILGTGGSSRGVFLGADGSTLNNAGTIRGGLGVYLLGADSTLTNSGTISGDTSGSGIFFAAGGSVTNTGRIEGGVNGVTIIGSAGTVTNSGTIISTTLRGVALYAGGSVDNTGLIQAPVGVYIRGGAGTVTNAGTILNPGTSGVGILLAGSGSISNSGSVGGSFGVYLFGAGSTLTNSGTITATYAYGVFSAPDGTVGNNAGLIEGAIGVYIGGTAGTVTNSATIIGTAGAGIILAAGGSVDNIAGGITGYNGVSIGGAGTVSNSGTISGTTARGVFFGASGSTLINSGTIGGAGGAVYFAGNGNLLAVDPGAVFEGTVYGGTGGTDTIELRSAASAGTVSGLGTSFTNFGTVMVDSGANWTLHGSFTGLVQNAGTLASVSPTYLNLFGTVINSGSLTAPFYILTGGFLTNQSTGIISGSPTYGGALVSASATTVNAGTITHTGTAGGFVAGVYLQGDSALTNGAGGLIQGRRGVATQGGSVITITNAGTIVGLGTSGYGIVLEASGQVTNTGLITAAGSNGFGIALKLGGSVQNSAGGTVEGWGFGVFGDGLPGTITNAGTIASPGGVGIGINLAAGGTIIHSGTISGGIIFGGTGSNLLGLQAGYKLYGGVTGGIGATNTVALFGSIGAPVTVDYNGLGLINFQNVLFGSGNNATLDVANTGTLGVTISGFDTTSEVIDLTGIGANGTITNNDTINHRVTITGSLGSVTLQLDASDATIFSTQPDGEGGTDLIACFCRGTRIRTDSGEVPVEDLAIGDMVVTLAGDARRVRWIGRRAYDGRFIAGNRAVMPIRVAAGALADCVPARDLFVSPCHALYLDGVLVPAGHLVNGATIVQADSVDRVEYFHIELDTHDIVFAEGAATESFVDCDNRMMFANAAEYARLYPQDDRPGWGFCVPRLERTCAELTAIRAALIDRAEAFGHELEADPGLHLVVDGAMIEPDAVAGWLYRFTVPGGGGAVLLASRSTVPAEAEPASCDIRRLGVAVERVRLYDDEFSFEVGHGHSALCDGFHADESGHRWTDGRACLPESWRRRFPGAFTLEVRLAPVGLGYRAARLDPVAASGQRAAAA